MMFELLHAGMLLGALVQAHFQGILAPWRECQMSEIEEAASKCGKKTKRKKLVSADMLGFSYIQTAYPYLPSCEESREGK